VYTVAVHSKLLASNSSIRMADARACASGGLSSQEGLRGRLRTQSRWTRFGGLMLGVSANSITRLGLVQFSTTGNQTYRKSPRHRLTKAPGPRLPICNMRLLAARWNIDQILRAFPKQAAAMAF